MAFLSDFDLHLFGEGTHLRAYEKMGCHPVSQDGVPGAHFAVWAPNAQGVCVMGDFNGWRAGAHPLCVLGESGVWAGFVPGVGPGERYKYRIESRVDGYVTERADPFGFRMETRPGTASIVADLSGHPWGDAAWMAGRGERHRLDRPISIYEVHLGSWRRRPEEGDRFLTYREAAPLLADHAREMGFTHVELLPLSEHPFDGSWGYQTTGYFAPTSRFGTPQDFMSLVDTLHQAGIGVILDWVPGHFPRDGHALVFFDGTHLYEHADPRRGIHREWDTAVFNFGRREVASFLLSNAIYWLDRYHVDGLRVDAVASMLYLDYSRPPGDWVPNAFGGRENLDAIAFLRRLNEAVYREFPSAFTVAEESTAWPMVSRPTYVGGLGFGCKWDMGWMHDTLLYLSKDPVHRKYHHGDLTFRMLYAYQENFLLPLSHDEVVHGKGSLLGRMAGDERQRFGNLRLLLSWQAAQPGKKLLFMGGEFGQSAEWNHDRSLDWRLLDCGPFHRGILNLVRDLNRLHLREPALHEGDAEPFGFEWVDCRDADAGVLLFERRARDPQDRILFGFNFTPVVRRGYRAGVERGGLWREILNSDSSHYGGSDIGNGGGVFAQEAPSHGRPRSLALTLPPLGAVALKPV